MSALLHPLSDAVALPESVLDGIWRASELGAATTQTRSTGYAALDTELPGAGWPRGSLTEILQAQPGLHEWRLLLPALRRALLQLPAVLIGCPHLPNLPALASRGIPVGSLLMVTAERPADRLWAAEQALRCGEVGALLAWLPKARPDQLRRLQMASQSGALPLVFVFRPASAEHESSPAPLRLRVQGAGRQGLQIHLLKRRGPSLDSAFHVPAPFPNVAALRARPVPMPATQPVPDQPVPAPPVPPIPMPSHVVDCPRSRPRGAEPVRA